MTDISLRRFALRALLLAAIGVGSIAKAAPATQPAEALPPGHSAHGDTFDEGPRRAAYLMGNTGKVHFPVTCKTAEAQRFFDQGIGQLHGFWYLESERSFRQVAAIDPDCAMAYWGMAMANMNNRKRARDFIAEAVKRKSNAYLTATEIAWIDALADFHKEDSRSDFNHDKGFTTALKAMHKRFPDNLEITAFLALEIWEFGQRDDFKLARKLQDEIFAIAPHHPANHYRIHLLDGPEAKDALTSAANNGPSAPGIAHMWHMPGHIYSDLHRYIDATWQQEASARVDHAYMIRDRVMPYEIHNYAHNNEWLIRDLENVGRVHDAMDLAKNMIELPRHPRYNETSNRGSGAAYGRARLIDVLSLHQMWGEYLAMCDSVYLSEDGELDHHIRKLRYQGVAYAALDRTADADRVIVKLEALRKSIQPPAEKNSANKPATRPAEKKAGKSPTAAGPGNSATMSVSRIEFLVPKNPAFPDSPNVGLYSSIQTASPPSKSIAMQQVQLADIQSERLRYASLGNGTSQFRLLPDTNLADESLIILNLSDCTFPVPRGSIKMIPFVETSLTAADRQLIGNAVLRKLALPSESNPAVLANFVAPYKPSFSLPPATRPAIAQRPATRPAVARSKRPAKKSVDRITTERLASIDRAISHINAEKAMNSGDFSKAASLLLAAKARKEHVALAYLDGKDFAKAEEAAKQAVEENPDTTYPLANQVLVLHRIGKKAEAAKAFDKLREISEAVDLRVEPYKSLGTFAADYGFKEDWRAPRKKPADLGERPPLDQLGPFRWHPSDAPDWVALSPTGSPVSLSQFHGKPVLVLFYLGHGCSHCVKQIHAFADMAKQYNDAGISIVAIGTDPEESLSKTWSVAGIADTAIPFPLASNASLDIFKTYHCYDDFEKTPLHGTFLIDPAGKIRWQDISYEPFMDAGFLLKESKRLLAGKP